jgi:Tfp pilus assembly protein PilV
MRFLLTLCALAVTSASAINPGAARATHSARDGRAAADYLRYYDAPHNLSVGVAYQVKVQISSTPTFATTWWGSKVTFVSSDPSVISVTSSGWGSSTGVVATMTATNSGVAMITATDQSGATAVDSILVSASAAPVASLRIQCSNGAWCDKASGRTVAVTSGVGTQLYVVALDKSGNVLWKQPVSP